jgi:hypothetical protein
MIRSREAIKLQTEIVNATSKLYALGYRINCTYIQGAGWASEIVNMNTGENEKIDEQEIIDAEQDKNKDYALDNMTCDDEMVIEHDPNKPRPFPGMEGKGIDGGSNE